MKFNKIDLQEGDYFDRTEFTPEQIEVIKDNYAYFTAAFERPNFKTVTWYELELVDTSEIDPDLKTKYHPVDFFPEVGIAFGGYAIGSKVVNNSTLIGWTPPEAPVAPETSVTNKRYNYVKKSFTLASEALLAFESGIELFYFDEWEPSDKQWVQLVSEKETLWAHTHLVYSIYIKEEVQWWETISEENPVYIYDGMGKIEKVFAPYGVQPYAAPLTKEQVQDIVSTMENFYAD